MIAVPSLHPAFLLRSADGTKGEARFRDTVQNDFAKAVSYLWRKPSWDEQVIWHQKVGRYVNLFPTVEEVSDFFQRAQGKKMAVDVETTGEQPLDSALICIGFATEDGDAICVPVLKQHGEAYWTSGDWDRVRGLLKWVFASLNYKTVFHNGSFDILVLLCHGFMVANWSDDTLLLHHCIDGELPHSLSYVTSRYLEVPYYKDDVKGKGAWLELDDLTLRSYNLRDVLTTIRVLPIMYAEAVKWRLTWLYSREVEMAQLMVRATLKGLLVDLQRRDDTTPDSNQYRLDKKTGLPTTELNPDFGKPLGLGPKMRQARAESLHILRGITGDQLFNPASPVQLQKLLYDQLKFPVVKRSVKTQKPSSDKDAMVLLSLHATPGPQQDTLRNLAKYRRADKMLGTYVEGLKLLADGRLHVSWKVHGTVSGRFSSSPNAQNLNGAVQRIFCSGPGADFVGVDLSQAEVRGIAYQSGDPDLLLAYEKGLNVHTVNATLLFQLRNPGEDTNKETEDYLDLACPATLGVSYQSMPVAPKSRWKRIRRLAKNFVFAANYGAIPETIFDTLRAERDPDTDEPLFPDLDLGLIEALKQTWETLHPSIPQWWKKITTETKQLGHYRCPITGRIRWFRGGFKQNEMINFPIQSMVASHMDRMIEIGKYMYQVAGDGAIIVAQVHDAIVSEVHKKFVQAVKDIYMYVLNKPFVFGNYPAAVFPADEPKVGHFLNEV